VGNSAGQLVNPVTVSAGSATVSGLGVNASIN